MSDDASNGNKGLENEVARKDVRQRTSTVNSAEVGAPPAQAAPARPALPKAVLERRWRRRREINSLAGLIREHGRLISAMHNGRVTLEKGEVLSRAYARHREMITAHEQQAQLAAIQAQLAALRGESGLLPRDDARESLEELDDEGDADHEPAAPLEVGT